MLSRCGFRSLRGRGELGQWRVRRESRRSPRKLLAGHEPMRQAVAGAGPGVVVPRAGIEPAACGLLLTRQPLCHLSYRGIEAARKTQNGACTYGQHRVGEMRFGDCVEAAHR